MTQPNRRLELLTTSFQEFDQVMALVRRLTGAIVTFKDGVTEFKGVLLSRYEGDPNTGVITLEFNEHALRVLARVAGDDSVLVNVNSALRAASGHLH